MAVIFRAMRRASFSAIGAYNKVTPSGIDYVVCDDCQLVHLENALDLQEQSAQEPEVASCDPGDACDSLSVGEVGSVKLQAKPLPVPGEHKRQLVSKKWPVMMGEPDPAEELRVAGHALLNAWHASQDEADIVPVEEVAQILQGDRVEAFRFVKDDQLHILPGHGA